jgi:hypothetical protein
LGVSFTHFFNRIGLMKSEIYKTNNWYSHGSVPI